MSDAVILLQYKTIDELQKLVMWQAQKLMIFDQEKEDVEECLAESITEIERLQKQCQQLLKERRDQEELKWKSKTEK